MYRFCLLQVISMWGLPLEYGFCLFYLGAILAYYMVQVLLIVILGLSQLTTEYRICSLLKLVLLALMNNNSSSILAANTLVLVSLWQIALSFVILPHLPIFISTINCCIIMHLIITNTQTYIVNKSVLIYLTESPTLSSKYDYYISDHRINIKGNCCLLQKYNKTYIPELFQQINCTLRNY